MELIEPTLIVDRMSGFIVKYLGRTYKIGSLKRTSICYRTD